MRMQGRMQTSISRLEDFELREAHKAVVRVAGEVEVENEVRAECGAYHNRVQIRHLLLVMQQISRSRRPLRRRYAQDGRRVEAPYRGCRSLGVKPSGGGLEQLQLGQEEEEEEEGRTSERV